MVGTTFAQQVNNGERFPFGDNWGSFLSVVDDDRIAEARRSLARMLATDDLNGKRFVDIGSGSGLFSLAARLMGAEVHSIDFDPGSVRCTQQLRARFFADDDDWTIREGSVLDRPMLMALGQFDIVYSWGVLHHTGQMWTALRNAIDMVAPGGVLFIAIYNDQGWKSHFWWMVKRFYNVLPSWLAGPFPWLVALSANAVNVVKYTLKRKPMDAIAPLLNYRQRRGMSFSHDLVDWAGGYPFEFATYDALVNYAEAAGLRHVRGSAATSLGCHEIVFSRPSSRTDN